jgi:hypothetical protein
MEAVSHEEQCVEISQVRMINVPGVVPEKKLEQLPRSLDSSRPRKRPREENVANLSIRQEKRKKLIRSASDNVILKFYFSCFFAVF